MKTRTKVLLGIFGFYLASIVLVVLIFGASRLDNEEFAPQNEFKLDTWIDLPGPLDFNKGVMYLLIDGFLTVMTMLYIANRMQARPNSTHTPVETLLGLMRDNNTRRNMDDEISTKLLTIKLTLLQIIW